VDSDQEVKLATAWFKAAGVTKWVDGATEAACYELDGKESNVASSAEFEDGVVGVGQILECVTDASGIKRVVKLRFGENPNLKTLPTGLGQFQELKDLDIRDLPALTELPADVGRLTGLEELRLYDNTGLKTLPPEMNLMTGLQGMYLDACDNLTCVPFMKLDGKDVEWITEGDVDGFMAPQAAIDGGVCESKPGAWQDLTLTPAPVENSDTSGASRGGVLVGSLLATAVMLCTLW